MKKALVFLVIWMSIMVSGCTVPGDHDSRLLKIDTMITRFSTDQINGFDYSVIQKNAQQEVLNQQWVEQRIDRSSDIKIYTEFTGLQLTPFDSNNTHIHSNQVIYYYQNEKGTQINDGLVTWEPSTLADYQTMRLPIVRIRKDDLKSYQISESETLNILTAEIELSRIESLTGHKMTGIISMQLEIRYQASTGTLISIKLTYDQTLSQTVMTFSPYYGTAEVILPDR